VAGRRITQIPLALSLLGMLGLLGCSEPVGPSTDRGLDLSASSGVRSSSVKGTTATGVTLPADAGNSSSGPAMLGFAPWALPLVPHDTSFLIVVGRQATHTLPFVGGKFPFLKLVIPKDAEFFDASGSDLNKGDTVRVTLAIDRVYAAISFGPHGSLFMGKKPATLYLNYYALDLRGRVPTTASIWYQPTSGDAWTALATDTDIKNWWLVTPIYHFSNYAIAYQR
jgi:hypothetical protein